MSFYTPEDFDRTRGWGPNDGVLSPEQAARDANAKRDAEIERLQKQLHLEARLPASLSYQLMELEVGKLSEETSTLKQQLAEAVEVIRFYDGWHQSTLDLIEALDSDESPMTKPEPNKARAFLQKIGAVK